ncbi:amino acid ABC transporter substrate-binding protein [Heyndrickxia coagulans]|jgi:cystine transport system substrate-binding protein|uniref:amino acid ABC transporter substrate-binding protein n=1 Tax=Heyndrickxia coagulans TaxID=1398 RepID=UPI0002110641|nr:amino acid ABC transporter substrate-binding protein [Heyndrickxia coagulans]AEH54337.1 extracellular solute-binding protein family 3 [Heyndrickxia coagulans 2-6]MEC5269825.1 amino acid ABC transporter substrate-binding protein [Heyndrickxia coagulans]MED4311581.1 amino acid ABC transporter substrate-binding protein [Heyndrickxia coagulans]MED4404501.1 amino acid ABC transporter substrate-binding protein [Heyndrickxia coagulans]MED4935921.1 amino acid ABC transporter substrate-binding prote
MRKYIKWLAVFSLLFALTACGKNTDNQNASKSNDLYDQIKSKGVLLIGTEGTYPPFSFHKNGKLTGYDIDVAKEVAKRLGLKAEFKETQWDAMFAGLNSKRFDMIANQVGIRADRQKKYDFSTPYTISKAVVLVRKDNTNIKSFADLKGKKSAQSLTSNYADIAKKNGANIVSVEGFNQAVQLLTSNRVDATVNDSLTYLDYKKQKPNAAIKVAATANEASKSAFLFRKHSGKLTDKVNDALKDMKKDGTLTKISKKWFGEDVSQ